MKTKLSIIILLALVSGVYAYMRSSWKSIDRYMDRAKEFVIADCVNPSAKSLDELTLSKFRIIEVWKGDRDLGEITIAGPSNLKKDQRYFLGSMGGWVHKKEINFIAQHDLYVIPIAQDFPLDYYKDHTLKEKIIAVMESALVLTKSEIRNLTRTKENLETILKSTSNNEMQATN